MTNSCSIEHSQGAIALPSTLLRVEWVISRTEQGPISLQREIRPGKSFGVGSACPLTRSIRDRLILLIKILICEHGLKGPAMQIQIQDICRSEGSRRDGGEELLIDDPVAPRADGRGRSLSWMRG